MGGRFLTRILAQSTWLKFPLSLELDQSLTWSKSAVLVNPASLRTQLYPHTYTLIFTTMTEVSGRPVRPTKLEIFTTWPLTVPTL